MKIPANVANDTLTYLRTTTVFPKYLDETIIASLQDKVDSGEKWGIAIEQVEDEIRDEALI